MAFEYFLYRTDIGNTLVDRGATSFAPLPPNTGEIFIDFSIPTNQPLYFYRESGGNIILNSDGNIDTYLSETDVNSNDSIVTFEDLDNYVSGATTLGGNNIFVDKVGQDLRFKGLVAGTNISLTSSANTLTISSTGGGVSELLFTGYTATTETRLNGIEDDINYISGQTGGKLNTSIFNTYTGTTAPNQFADKTIFNSYTATTDVFLDSISGASIGETISAIPFQAVATGNLTLTNQSSLAQFLSNSNRNITKADLTNTIEIRIISRVVTASASVNSPRLIVRYSPTFTTNVASYLDVGIGGTPVELSLSSTGVVDSGWVTLRPEAKGDVFLTIIQIGGDGVADPSLAQTDIRLKNIVRTVDSLSESLFTGYTATTETRLTGIEADVSYISGQTGSGGVSELLFTGYTATTETRLNGIEDDINYISGVTDIKLDITDFNSYTATTQTELNNINSELDLAVTGGTSGAGISVTKVGRNLNVEFTGSTDYVTNTKFNTYTGTTETRLSDIEDDIDYISGVTDSKLNTIDFNIYTGTTNTRLDNIEDDIIYLSGQTDLKLNISDFNSYTGATDTRLDSIEDDIIYLSGITDTKLDGDIFTGYTAITESKLWNVFEPLNGTTPDDQRFEAYANIQNTNGQPIFLHDPSNLGFVFTGLTTGKVYNYLPWIGVNGGTSAPRLKLYGGSVFSSSGIRGVELFIAINANVTLIGLSEHANVDLAEIRFEIGGTGNSLTVNAVNMTVGRVEGQTGTSNLIIKDRSYFYAQNLNEIENVYVEGGSILEANWMRINTTIRVGFNGTTTSNNAVVTIAKPQNLTTGKIFIYGSYNTVNASNFPIEVISGSTNNNIIGSSNTIVDNGTNTIILQNLNDKLDISDFNSYTGTTETRLQGIEDDIIYISGQTGSGVSESLFTGYTATTDTRLDGIDADIIYLSGQTDTKLATIDFNSYTATTYTSINDRIPYSGATKTINLNNKQLNNVNRIQSSTALFGSNPSNLRAFNVKGSGLDGRLSLQGFSGDNPGLEMTTTDNATRVLLRLQEVLTDGTSLEIFVDKSSGTTSKAMQIDEDSSIYLFPSNAGVSPAVNTGIRNSSGIMQFKNASGGWVNMVRGSDFNTYTGTTAPATYLFKTGGTITGSLGVNGSGSFGGSLSVAGAITENGNPLSTTYLSISNFNTYTGSSSSITTANNGLTKSGTNVRLGGSLTGATVITSPATGSRLSFAGFPIQYSTDVSANYNVRSVVDRGYVTGITSTLSTTANNGITKSGQNFRLGGSLTGGTNLNLNTFNFNITGSSGTLTAGSSRFAILNPANTFRNIFVSSAIAANRNITIPLLTGDDTLVTAAFAQTLTNKTLTSPVVNTQISGGVTSGGNITGTNFIVGATATQTLTNKTLTSPTINGGAAQYSADFSGSFNNRSLVDKEYVTGLTSQIVYGTQYQLASDLTSTSTTSTTPVAKVTMNTTSLPSGTYKITVCWLWTRNVTNSSGRFNVTVGGVAQGTTQTMEMELSDASDFRTETRIFYLALSGVNEIIFNHWSENGGSSTTTSDATIELIRVA